MQKSERLCLVTFLVLMLHLAGAAVPLTQSPTSPGGTTTLQMSEFSTLGAPVTNQASAFGVTFAGGWFQGGFAGIPNISNEAIHNPTTHFGNIFTGPTNSPISFTFSGPVSSAFFALGSVANVPDTFTVRSFLGASLVESFVTAQLSTSDSNNFYGFSSSMFDRIEISRASTNGNGHLVLDNLSFSLAGSPGGAPELDPRGAGLSTIYCVTFLALLLGRRSESESVA